MATNTSIYTPPISRYMPIWNELKANGKCRLSAPPVLHPRIIKAVKKRRDKDIAFRFMLSEGGKKARFKFESKGSIITITLIISIGLDDL